VIPGQLPVAPAWLALAAGGLYLAVLWRLDAYTPRDVRHFERLAALRGLGNAQGLGQRVGRRLGILRRLREELDIRLLLVISGATTTAEAWLMGTAAAAVAALALLVGLDALAALAGGPPPVPAWISLVAAGLVVAARYMALRTRAQRRQERIQVGLMDSLLGLAVLVPGMPSDDALALLSRAQLDRDLADVLRLEEVERVLGPTSALRATHERYWALGRLMRLPALQELSLVIRAIDAEGLNPREEYQALARVSATNRLAHNRMRAARAKTLSAAAIALLLVPLLIMVGGGVAFAFLSGFAG